MWPSQSALHKGSSPHMLYMVAPRCRCCLQGAGEEVVPNTAEVDFLHQAEGPPHVLCLDPHIGSCHKHWSWSTRIFDNQDIQDQIIRVHDFLDKVPELVCSAVSILFGGSWSWRATHPQSDQPIPLCCIHPQFHPQFCLVHSTIPPLVITQLLMVINIVKILGPIAGHLGVHCHPEVNLKRPWTKLF